MNKINEKAVAFLPIEKIEPQALQQVVNTSTLPFVFHHVAVMPDCHFGKGATVGTVLPTMGAIVPAAVGVDIGCGMIAVKTNLKREDLKDLHALRIGIERRIPMSAGKFNNKILDSAKPRIEELEKTAGIEIAEILSKNWREQLGTLGGGNHFIEVCLDENGTVWATLHSGSRGVGNKIGMFYIKKAQELMEKMFITLPDNDLAYLPENEPEFNNYIRDLRWSQKFALLNREEMMDRFLTELKYNVFGTDNAIIELERINSHHNYSQIENHFGKNVWITRKGAIKADVGDRAMIPGSMGTRSYIVSGLGNKMSFNSAPHGAGRNFSRGEARRRFTRADLERAMEGIEFRNSDVLIDEIPSAYKDIDEVMENAKDLVKVEYTLKQILNIKGD